MNKILRFVCRQADFKKIVSIGFFAAFLAVFLSAGTAQASFFDWFNFNKASNDSQQAAAVTNTKATSTAPIIKVISPNGGEVWKAGTKKNIVFKGNLVKEKVDILLQWAGNSILIGDIVTGDSKTEKASKSYTYFWAIPTTLEQRNDYKISVYYRNIIYNNSNIQDESDKTFTIKNASSASSSSRSSKSSATTTRSYLLKIIKVGKGSVTDEQRQIVCGTGCKGDSGSYTAGSEAKITAVPDGGYVFEKFSPEKECSSIYTSGFGFNDNKWTKQAFAYKAGENVVCVTTMNKNKTITAIFKKISTRSSSSSSKSSATTTPSNV